MNIARLATFVASVAGIGAWAFAGVHAQPPPQAPFNVDRYQPATLMEVLARHSSSPGVTIVRDLPVRTAVVYSGEFRELSLGASRVIQEWSTVMQVPVARTVFRREVLVREGAQEFWLPVQETLAVEMRDELGGGQSIEVFAVYIGQVDGRHVFLINAFDHKGPHRPRRGT